MTWREFQLRRIGYLRKQKEQWYHTRFIAYYNLKGAGALKNESIDRFMDLDDKKISSINSEQKKLVAEMQKNILKII